MPIRNMVTAKKSQKMEWLSDLHCHMLPCIDDGASSIEMAYEMLEMSALQGVKQIVFTPHFDVDRQNLHEFLKARQRSFESIQACIDRLGIKARLGAEIYFRSHMAWEEVQQLCFENTPYFLVELSVLNEPVGLNEWIREAVSKGWIPLIAHVERYRYIKENPEILKEWIHSGAYIQSNAGWFLKSRHNKKIFKKYMENGWIDCISSDAHDIRYRMPNLQKAYQKLDSVSKEKLRIQGNMIFEGKTWKWFFEG